MAVKLKHPTKEFSPGQIKAIELLAAGGYKIKDICNELGLCRQTIFEWRRDPQFMDAVISRSRELIKENLPDIYSSLVGQAKNGNTPSIKLVLEHLEKLEEMKKEMSHAAITFTWEKD